MSINFTKKQKAICQICDEINAKFGYESTAHLMDDVFDTPKRSISNAIETMFLTENMEIPRGKIFTIGLMMGIALQEVSDSDLENLANTLESLK